MISVENLTVSFGGQNLFNDISFLINPKDRIGLVGKNGAGKSTLLKVLIGEQPATSGAVTRNGDCTLGYLPQQMKVFDTTTLAEETASAFREVNDLEAEIARITEEITVRTDYESEEYARLLHRLNDATDRYHILGGDNREAEIEKTLLGLGFRREDFGRPTREFSGGWRMRIELAKLLLRRPSVFLLDEPTNHLDIESIQWLESYLKEYNGAVLLISHDRAFLDNVTTRTIELSLGKVYDYKVPYSKFVELRRERREQQIAAYNNQQKMIEDTENFIERFRYKPTKSNQVQSRIKQLEKIERIEIDEEDVATLNIKFPPAPRSGQVVAEVKDAGKSFGPKRVFSGANFHIERGEKVALVGRNGEGKTTFVRMLTGELEPTEGMVRVGYNVNIGYFAQNQDDLMEGEFTVFDTLDRVAVGDIRTRLRDILGAFLFRGEEIDKKVKVLSGGERSRLAMARLMLEPYNLLILDEPTNHMDMRSKDILKNALMKYDGTVIVVSHDREFLDGLVNKVYEFRDGAVKEYLGGIYYFLEKRKLESLRDVEIKKAEAPAEVPRKKVQSKQDYQQRKEAERAVRKTKNEIDRVEARISELEAEIAEWDRRMADPAANGIDLGDPSVFETYNGLKQTLAARMHDWEKLNYELDLLTEQV
ncbi:ribosomal protection-like ABC-F family protein [Gallalistipes aquisgranensis]|uniref:ribosomal protection-like ABC-F family protein n=1 Tax=Gallalistipes aquisgranensis TaxID=2779358 RepID=UPI001CF838D2|nr:ABC-F family ATP-binding cassette domain-containing protein [Gallalistipes aquisgranensis]MBE5033738.1 ABC-F family ATP-binding cassette domain-containing protein [Gallalistipes aquisgranensis]